LRVRGVDSIYISQITGVLGEMQKRIKDRNTPELSSGSYVMMHLSRRS